MARTAWEKKTKKMSVQNSSAQLLKGVIEVTLFSSQAATDL